MPSARPPKSHALLSPKSRATSLKSAIIFIVTLNCLVSSLLVAGKDLRVQLDLYYESRCPSSVAFFLEQLVPTYRAIGSIMKLRLVPYGNAVIYSNKEMYCDHGPKECEENRLMACILKRGNDSEAIETIGCLLGGSPARSCVSNHMPSDVSFSDVEACQKGDESFKMMEEYKTLTEGKRYVPWVVLNGKHSQNLQDRAEEDLMGLVCESYEGKKPDVCKS